MGAPIRRLLFLATALAGPVMGFVARRQETTEYKFTPGPGMPSVESLGLTVGQLFNKTWVDELFQDTPRYPNGAAEPLSRRWENHCDEVNAPIDMIRACAAFLFALGTHPCVGTNSPIPFARVERGEYFALVQGVSVQLGPTQSWCEHSARAVYWVADNCEAGCDASVCAAGGAAHAWGNDNLVLVVSGNYY